MPSRGKACDRAALAKVMPFQLLSKKALQRALGLWAVTEQWKRCNRATARALRQTRKVCLERLQQAHKRRKRVVGVVEREYRGHVRDVRRRLLLKAVVCGVLAVGSTALGSYLLKDKEVGFVVGLGAGGAAGAGCFLVW